MSLKAFHLAFIVAAALLAVALGAWLLGQPGGPMYRVLAFFSFAAAVGLGLYGVWFVRKLRGVSYL